MAVKTNRYRNRTVQDTSRGPSNAIWGDCPIIALREGLGGGGEDTFGFLIEDDFVATGTPGSTAAITSMGQWAAWCAASTTVTDAAQEGGVFVVTNSGTASKSLTLASNAGAFRMVGASTNFKHYGKLWFECRVALGVSVAASQQAVFVGLADNTGSQINSSDVTVIASGGGTIGTVKNAIGFINRTATNPADFGFAFCPAGGSVVHPTNLQTLVTTVAGAVLAPWAVGTDGVGTGYVKLGFVWDPTADNPAIPITSASSGQTAGAVKVPLIQVFVNGQLAPAFLTSTNTDITTFPVNAVFSPVISVMNIQTGGSATNAYIDWIRVAQLGTT